MAEHPAAKKGGGLFGAKPPKEPEGPSSSYLSQEITGLSTRLRILEERSTNTKRKLEIVDQNMLSHRKKYSDDIDMLKEEIDEMRSTIKEVESRIIMIIKEIRLGAKKDDVDALKKYVELWEPVKFVTMNQVENIVREMLEDAGVTKPE